jgi:aarF domain-containing kinase
MVEMARSRASGEAARIQLSPKATKRFTDRLARMRGAVMKMGQLMSMDGSDVFTPEAAEIMATLRDRAEPMPMSQLTKAAGARVGQGLEQALPPLRIQPIAAAQHRPGAPRRDPRRPPAGAEDPVPGRAREHRQRHRQPGLPVAQPGHGAQGHGRRPDAGRGARQLHQEADYEAEAASLMRYRELIGDDPTSSCPACTPTSAPDRILAMDFAEGVSIDHLAEADYSRAERDRAAALLVRLMLRELFDFGLMQTDPNFGNYLYDADTKRVVLLDFGAALTVPREIATQFRALAHATLAGDEAGMRTAAIGLGYMAPDADEETARALVEMMQLSGEVLQPGIYDFGTSDMFERVYVKGRDMFMDEAFNHLPESITMFLQRKFAGMFMLCRRLRARVDLRELIDP